MRVPPEVAADQFGVFTTAQAHAAGWTASALSHAVTTDHLRHPRRGVYALRTDGPLAAARQDAAAATLAEYGSAASHRSAALLMGLPVLITPDRPCLTIQSRRHGTVKDTHLHRARLEDVEVHSSGSIRHTSAARTVVDIGRECGRDAGVVSADAALRAGLADLRSMNRAAAGQVRWPGIRRAMRVLSELDGRAESPLESLSRLRILDAGLPRPRLQANVHDNNGRWIARTDFLWDDFGVVGEADGLGKYDSGPTALRAEKLRQEAIEMTGLIVVRWGWTDLWQPDLFISRLRAAMHRGSTRRSDDRRWLVAA